MAEITTGEDIYGGYNDAYDSYDKYSNEAKAAYERMAREAMINRALLERAGRQSDSAAGITYKATAQTVGLRNDNSLHNVMGKTQRQYENYQKNVKNALENLKIQEAADDKMYAARQESERSANELTQGRADAEYGLQENQLKLYRTDSDFNKAYQLYLMRGINKNKFKDITGISVKSLPRPKAVLPAMIQYGSVGAGKASMDKNYSPVTYTDANNTERLVYVRNDVFNSAKNNGVSLIDNGSPKDLLTLAEEICGAEANKGIIKAGTKKVGSMADYRDYAMLPGTDIGNSTEYYFVNNELINAARNAKVPLYENGKLKSEMQLQQELGSNDWWLNTLDYMTNKQDDVVNMFGEDNYSILSSYAAYSSYYAP